MTAFTKSVVKTAARLQAGKATQTVLEQVEVQSAEWAVC